MDIRVFLTVTSKLSFQTRDRVIYRAPELKRVLLGLRVRETFEFGVSTRTLFQQAKILALGEVSDTVRREATDVFFSKSTFTFLQIDTMKAFASILPGKWLNVITAIAVEFLYDEGFGKGFQRLIDATPSLSRLELSFRFERNDDAFGFPDLEYLLKIRGISTLLVENIRKPEPPNWAALLEALQVVKQPRALQKSIKTGAGHKDRKET